MHTCTVCGERYPATGTGVTDICLPCLEMNFSGGQPPLDLPAPLAREMIEAYVDTGRYEQLTPRQREAVEDYALAMHNPQLALSARQRATATRMAAVWRRQAQED